MKRSSINHVSDLLVVSMDHQPWLQAYAIIACQHGALWQVIKQLGKFTLTEPMNVWILVRSADEGRVQPVIV